MIVADTNLVAYFSIQSEQSALAEAVFAADDSWAAPLLWRAEFRNTLVNYLRAGRMSMDMALHSLQTAADVIERREYPVDSEKVLALAAKSGCSGYDCEYVALAMDFGVPLVTSDKQILREFPKIAVSLEQFAKEN